MKRYHFYHEETGVIAGGALVLNQPDGHEETAQKNAPPGHAPIEGVFDHLAQRVDVDKLAADDSDAATAWAARRDERKTAHLLRTQADPSAVKPAFADPPPPRLRPTAAHIVDYQPPQPSTDHEWNKDVRRWQLTKAASIRQNEQASARAMIAKCETAALRPQRELALGIDGAKDRLQAIDNEIAQWRAKL